MNHFPIEFTRVLAIDPSSRGLGFMVLEGPSALIDWGFYNARKDRNTRCIAYAISMFTKYQPDVLVLEDFAAMGNRRPLHVRALTDGFAAAAKDYGIDCHRLTRGTIRAKFPSCRTKYDIARELADRFSEIKPLCPPTRKFWLPEKPCINIFDALSFAVTYLTRPTQDGEPETLGD